jgi:hypothetical protein
MKQAKHNQQVQVTRSSKVKEQVNRQGDASFVSSCSFLFRGSMSTLERCGTTKFHQLYKGLTFFSSELTTKVNPTSPLSGYSRGGNQTFTKGWGTLHKSIGGSRHHLQAHRNTKQA